MGLKPHLNSLVKIYAYSLTYLIHTTMGKSPKKKDILQKIPS